MVNASRLVELRWYSSNMPAASAAVQPLPSTAHRSAVIAAGPWTPVVHARYPPRARERIFELVLLSRAPDAPAALRAGGQRLLLCLADAIARLNYI